MQRTMLKSKIHRATITDSDLHYVGSVTVDPDLLEAADILEHGQIKINGAAARLVHTGDTVILISYGQYDKADMEHYEPRVVHVEEKTNRIITVDDAVATLLTS